MARVDWLDVATCVNGAIEAAIGESPAKISHSAFERNQRRREAWSNLEIVKMLMQPEEHKFLVSFKEKKLFV